MEANKPSLSPEDYQRYEQQANIMGEICKSFENEEQGAEDKEGTFESIMELMQKVNTPRIGPFGLWNVNEAEMLQCL